jgi:branched-chain amino acid transport system ATP-binding protein
MLNIENISVTYGNRLILHDISLQISKEEIILLVGANGSGKSSLLKAIYGLVPKSVPFSGKQPAVWFNKENITNAYPSDLLKRQLMYISQKDNLFNDLTVHENLEMAGAVLDTVNRKKRIGDIYSMFGVLKKIKNNLAMKMSGGERKILAFAMTYLHEPELVMLDEPFAGLNANNIELLTNMIRSHNRKGMSFLIVEHKITESLPLAHRVLVLKEGRFLHEFKKEEEAFDVDAINKLFT